MRRTLTAFLGVIVLGLAATPGHAAENNLGVPQLRVFVYNDARTPSRLLVSAEGTAARVFQQAGIDVTWIDCGPPAIEVCGAALQAGDLAVRILSGARAPQPGIFGVSFLGADGAGAYADVFLDRIQRLREEASGISLASTLGDVIAHELGHLLLGSHAHSQQGIMQAHWQAAQLRDVAAGHMLFTPDQARQMRARIATMKEGHERLAELAAAGGG